jgi:uncharacterized protein (DUF1810 family)
MSLERFHEPQANRSAGYDTALAEIRAGGKRSHWIWYVFPQIEGLGRSSTAQAYAIRDLGEACAYLSDPILPTRYEEIVAAVSEELLRGIGLEDLMGGRTDALKLVSSLTLFRTAAEQLAGEDPTYASLVKRLGTSIEQTKEQGYPRAISRLLGSIP